MEILSSSPGHTQSEVLKMFVNDDCVIDCDPAIRLKNGDLSHNKIDAEKLSPDSVDRLVGFVAAHPAFMNADAVAGMPDGMTDFAQKLHERTGKPVIELRKVYYQPGVLCFARSSRRNFEEAIKADHIIAIDDVTTSGSTFAAARSLLPTGSAMSTLSLLMRGQIKPEYNHGFQAHHALARAAIKSDMSAQDVVNLFQKH